MESMFTANSARCPVQLSPLHVVYSSTRNPTNPKDRLTALVIQTQIKVGI